MSVKVVCIALLLLGVLCAVKLSEQRGIPKAGRRRDRYDGMVMKSMKQLLRRSKRQSDDEPQATPNQEYFSDASNSFASSQTYGSSSLTSSSDHVSYTSSDDKSGQASSSKYVFPDKIRYASLTDPASTPAPTRPPTTTPGTGRHRAQYEKYGGSLYTGGGSAGGRVSGTQLYGGNSQPSRGSGVYGGAKPLANYYNGGQQQGYYSLNYQQKQSPYQGGYQAKQQSHTPQGYGPTSYVNPYASAATYSNQNTYRGAGYSSYADPYSQSSSYQGMAQGYQSGYGRQMPTDSSGNPLSNGVYGRPMGGRTTYTGSDIRVGSSSTRYNPSSSRSSGSLPYSSRYSNGGSSSMNGMQKANPYATASSNGGSLYGSSYGGSPSYYGQSSNSRTYGSRTQGSLSNPSYGASSGYANPYGSSGSYYGSSSISNPSSYGGYSSSSYGSLQNPYRSLSGMTSDRSYGGSAGGRSQTPYYGSSSELTSGSNYRDSQTGYGSSANAMSSSYGGASSPYGSSSNSETSGSVYGGSSRPSVGSSTIYGSQAMPSARSDSSFGNSPMSLGGSSFTYGNPSLSSGRTNYGNPSTSQGGAESSYRYPSMPQGMPSYTYGNSRLSSSSSYGNSRMTQHGMSGPSPGRSGTPSVYSSSGLSQMVPETLGSSSRQSGSSVSSGSSYENSDSLAGPTYGGSSASTSQGNPNSRSPYLSSDRGSNGGFSYSSSNYEETPNSPYGDSSSSLSGIESGQSSMQQSSYGSRSYGSSNIATGRNSYSNPQVPSDSSYQYQYPHRSSGRSSQGSTDTGASRETNYQESDETGSYGSTLGGGQASTSQIYQSSNQVGTKTDESPYIPGSSNSFPSSQDGGSNQPGKKQLYTYQGLVQYGGDNDQARSSLGGSTSFNSGGGYNQDGTNIATEYVSSESRKDVSLTSNSGQDVATYSPAGIQANSSLSSNEGSSRIENSDSSASNVASEPNYQVGNHQRISDGSSSFIGSSSQQGTGRGNPMRILPSRSRGRNRGHRITSASQEVVTVHQPEVSSTTSRTTLPFRGYGQTGNSEYEAGYSDSYPDAYDPNDYSSEDTADETTDGSPGQGQPLIVQTDNRLTTAAAHIPSLHTSGAPPRGNRQQSANVLVQTGVQSSRTAQTSYLHSVQTSRNGDREQSSILSVVSTQSGPGSRQHGAIRGSGNVENGVLLVRMRNLSSPSLRPISRLPSVSTPVLNAQQHQEQRIKLPDIHLDKRKLITHFFLDRKPLSTLLCARGAGCLSSSAYRASRSSQRKLLRFQTTVHNIGDAPFLPALAKSDWTFHQCHNHSHSMEVFTHYDLLDLNRKKVAEGHKASFCLEDSSCRKNIKKTYNCDRGHQGISAGCEDTYKASIDCQWIDVTGVHQDDYIFRVTINPDRLVRESNYDNNGVECRVSIKRYTADIWGCKVVGV